MSNPVAEIMDVFFNGRPAPKDNGVIRVQIKADHLRHLENGGHLLFTANGTKIIVTLKGGRQ